MAWSRFDDGFYDHPKVLGLSHPAFRLHVCGITYCSRHNTGGTLATGQVIALCRLLGIPPKAAKELVEAGCWHDEDGGYSIHDYAVYHPKDPTGFIRQQRHRDGKNNASRNGSVTDESVTETVTLPLPLPLSLPLRQRDSRVAARACPDPTRPDPTRPVTYTDTPTASEPEGGGEGEAVGSAAVGGRDSPNEYAEMPLAEVAARLPYAELLRRVRLEKPEYAPTITAALSASNGKRRTNEAVYLRPLCLRIALNQEPSPTAAEPSPPEPPPGLVAFEWANTVEYITPEEYAARMSGILRKPAREARRAKWH